MAHVRKQIRDAVVAAVTGLATTGGNVFRERVYPVERADLPGLTVSSAVEQTEVQTLRSPRKISRRYSVTIAASARATSSLDDTLDAICAEVEAAIFGNATVAALAKSLELETTTFDLTGDAEKPFGTASMTWVFDYWAAEGAPETAV